MREFVVEVDFMLEENNLRGKLRLDHQTSFDGVATIGIGAHGGGGLGECWLAICRTVN